MRRFVWHVIGAVLVATTLGCAEENGGTGGTGAMGGLGGSGGAGGTDTVTLSVRALEAQGFPPVGPALEGVTLCETTDTENCATTNEEGMASIEVPADQEISFTLEKEGYASYLVADVSDEALSESNGPWAMYSDEITADLFEALGISNPMGGQMVFRAVAGTVINGIAGVTFDLVDETATPFYFAEGTWTPSFDLTATTSAGQGGFAEQSAGEYQVEFGGTAANCSAQIGWPGDAPNRIKVPVRAGYLTFSTMDCDEP